VLKRIGLVAGLVAVVIAALFLTGVVGGDDQSKVSVERGAALPKLSSLNRADDAGADTLRAYLAAALACDASGERLMAS
jgi:Tfp pilus assembly protein PilN